MRLPSFRTLLTVYVVLLVAIFAGKGLHQAVSDLAGVRDDLTYALTPQTHIELLGASPLRAAPVGAQAYYFGPLNAGECLPPIDVRLYRPSADFHNFGVKYEFGEERDGFFRTRATYDRMPARLPKAAPLLRLCFPAGIEHEMALGLLPADATVLQSPFAGAPAMVPPPFRKQPFPVRGIFPRLLRGYLSFNEQSIFPLVGRRVELSASNAVPVVVEVGDFGADWKFQVRETFHVGPGSKPARPQSGAAYFRIYLPQGAESATLQISPLGPTA